MDFRDAARTALNDLVKEYRRPGNEACFLTENDVVCWLYSRLRESVDLNEVVIHSELRPFFGVCEDPMVIAETDAIVGWCRQRERTRNSGFRVDLSMVTPDKALFQKALDKANDDQGRAPKLKYWRILSYPVEAFRIAMEVKIKVHQNKERIVKDMEKLSQIRALNDQCDVYLVILDRESNPKRLEELKIVSEKTYKIKCYTSLG